jgi:hypothetical protein
VPGFDPLRLSNFASLNRTRLADAAVIDPALRGKAAQDLLSARALHGAVAERAGALGLEAERRRGKDLLPAFDQRLASMDEGVRTAAVELAVRFGTYLGYLLVSLTAGPSTAGVDDELAPAYRAHWSGVGHVVLGGGVVSGRLGRIMREVAREMVTSIVSPSFRFDLADYPEHLPLIGAALGLGDPQAPVALAYDFGGTRVKRGRAFYDSGALTAVRLLPATTIEATRGPWEQRPEAVRALGEAMSELIASDWQAAGDTGVPLSNEVACSVNGYVAAEHPRDIYSAVLELEGEADWLSADVSKRVGRRITVRLSHDGTAAARVLAGQPNAAVIMLGTWLGVGFPPGIASVLSLAPSFRLS